jgi:hypothetical protein
MIKNLTLTDKSKIKNANLFTKFKNSFLIFVLNFNIFLCQMLGNAEVVDNTPLLYLTK